MNPLFVLITVVLVIVIVWLIRALLRGGKQAWRQQRQTLLWLALAVLALLAITKKLHVLGILLAGFIPLAQRLAPLLLRYGPTLHKQYKQNTQHKNHQRDSQHEPPHRPGNPSSMSSDEAWEILGLRPGANKADILARHKQLIQKLHPDRGGSNYLTARINQARDLLLKGL
ncbi:MAG: molecular chaperone DnaJ [Gammaproteobacteria bacterium]|jgi:DnaJ homolog subfamily C member 19